MGAGLEIACCCDMRLAAQSAKFGAPIAKLGFPMAPREAALVRRVAGELTAREMLLAASVLDSAAMMQRGFLNAVLADEALGAQAQVLSARISSLAPQAARLNKQSFRALAHSTHGLPATDLIASAYRYADSDEHREGVGAFVAKRPPRF